MQLGTTWLFSPSFIRLCSWLSHSLLAWVNGQSLASFSGNRNSAEGEDLPEKKKKRDTLSGLGEYGKGGREKGNKWCFKIDISG